MKARFLSDGAISAMIARHQIVVPSGVQPASLDVPLAGFFMLGSAISAISEWPEGSDWSGAFPNLHGARAATYSVGGSAIEPGNVLWFRGACMLELPPRVGAVASPKSTAGRLDLLVQTRGEGVHGADWFPPGYRGGVAVQATARAFPVGFDVSATLPALSQLRFFEVAEEGSDAPPTPDVEIPLTVDLSVPWAVSEGCRSPVPWFASGLDPSPAWTPGGPCDAVVLRPDRVYLFASTERLHVPAQRCAEVSAYSPRLGEFRAHAAGFIDPGFVGRVTLEVRTFGVPIRLRHRDQIATCAFYDLDEPAARPYGTERGSSYQNQNEGARLPRQFRPFWTGPSLGPLGG